MSSSPRPSDRRVDAAACEQDETAVWAFADALLALQELGHADVAERLRARWGDVEASERYARPP